ncbi:MAG TPA: MurR/RpiR family transcriptional regulator [Limnochordia bacterium]|nr:MurR/RpiR family transcriptional regulator [Limnochordia bacterium]
MSLERREPVAGRIRMAIGSSTPTGKAIGGRLLQWLDGKGAAGERLTTGTIAQAVGCSRVSVVRFARELGYPGFSELQRDLIVEGAGRPDPKPQPAALVRMLDVTRQLLEQALDSIDPVAFEQAVQRMAAATRRVWFGVGDSAHLAASADHRCAVLGMSSQSVSTTPHLAAVAQSLEADDLVVAISQSGRSRPLVKVITETRAFVLGITASGNSRLAEAAGCTLLTPVSDFKTPQDRFTVRAPQALVVDALLLAAGERRGVPIEGWSDASH